VGDALRANGKWKIENGKLSTINYKLPIRCEAPPLPIRPPVLCAGCPHRASFFAVKEALRGERAVFSGDIGCYTLGNAAPLDMVDTCLCMGAGVTMAQGLGRVSAAVNVAFIGDSTFFHTGLAGVVNAVWNGASIIIAVLDNGTTAMTGGQANPGMGTVIGGAVAPALSIEGVVRALGVERVWRVNAFNLAECKSVVRRAVEAGAECAVRVIIFEGKCITVNKKPSQPVVVDREKCTGCLACVKKLGCPALSPSEGGVAVDKDLCTGCGLCVSVCGFGAIVRRTTDNVNV
jgi:indolepyruvate ferredoxin oxidoreductase alpha subunit